MVYDAKFWDDILSNVKYSV